MINFPKFFFCFLFFVLIRKFHQQHRSFHLKVGWFKYFLASQSNLEQSEDLTFRILDARYIYRVIDQPIDFYLKIEGQQQRLRNILVLRQILNLSRYVKQQEASHFIRYLMTST